MSEPTVTITFTQEAINELISYLEACSENWKDTAWPDDLSGDEAGRHAEIHEQMAYEGRLHFAALRRSARENRLLDPLG